MRKMSYKPNFAELFSRYRTREGVVVQEFRWEKSHTKRVCELCSKRGEGGRGGREEEEGERRVEIGLYSIYIYNIIYIYITYIIYDFFMP